MEHIIFLGVGFIIFTAVVVAIAYFVKGKEELTKEQELNWKLASYGKFQTDRCTMRVGDYAKYFNDIPKYKGWR